MRRAIAKEVMKYVFYFFVIVLAGLTFYAFSLVLLFGLVAKVVQFPNWEYVCLAVFLLLFFRGELVSLKIFLTSIEWGRHEKSSRRNIFAKDF